MSLGLAFGRVRPELPYPQEPPRWAELVTDGELPAQVVEAVKDLDDVVLVVVHRPKTKLTARTKLDFTSAARDIMTVAGSIRPDETFTRELGAYASRVIDDPPHVRAELPWLRSGPLFRVRSDATDVLDQFLERFAYRRIDLDGRQMTSRDAAHAELGRAFGFPSYYGKNWDSFNSLSREFVEDHDGELIALVWRDVDVAAAAAPVTTTEVGWAMLDLASTYQPSLVTERHWQIWMDVFVTGDGGDFDHP